MRYVISFLWTFLLTQLLTYVVTSMTYATYDFKTGLILGVAVWVVLMIIPTVLPEEPVQGN